MADQGTSGPGNGANEPDPAGRTLSVIVPVFDERNSDGTSQILNALEDSTVMVVRHPANMGKGAAIRTGLQQVRGEFVLIQRRGYRTGVVLGPAGQRGAQVRLEGRHAGAFHPRPLPVGQAGVIASTSGGGRP